jgi:hypothetical protein
VTNDDVVALMLFGIALYVVLWLLWR